MQMRDAKVSKATRSPVQRIPLLRNDAFIGRAEELGFNFHTSGAHEYWVRDACYGMTEDAITSLDGAAREIVAMSDAAADHVVRSGDYRGFGFSDTLCSLVESSHKAQEPSLYGRLDLRLDHDGSVKLFEFNAESPAVLLEAATVQLAWFEQTSPGADTRPGIDQWSSIYDALVDRWSQMSLPSVLHFAAEGHRADEIAQAAYLMSTATDAGHHPKFLAMHDIGRIDDGHPTDAFTDPSGTPIDVMFKLYPWDWMVREAFAPHLKASRTRWIQPARRMLQANKALLAVMWDMFPGHPNLLPASLDREAVAGPAIGKPALGLEGAGMAVSGVEGLHGTDIDEGHTPSPRIWQAWAPPPCHRAQSGADAYPVFGVWVVGDEPCGLGIREAAGPITTMLDRFVPHVVL